MVERAAGEIQCSNPLAHGVRTSGWELTGERKRGADDAWTVLVAHEYQVKTDEREKSASGR